MKKTSKHVRYSGIQPQYFPRLHYFARILSADYFVLRDDCQFVRKHKYPNGRNDKSYQANTPIKQASGVFLLTVPTQHSGYKPIYETLVSYDYPWNVNQLKSINFNYSRSPNHKTLIPEIDELLKKDYSDLSEFNITTLVWSLLHLLGEETQKLENYTLEYINSVLARQKTFRLKEIVKGTQTKSFKNFDSLSPNEKIVSLCKEFGVTEDYCGGTAISAYVDRGLFEKNGISITVQDWKCAEYPQQHANLGFIPNLSIIDLLMNVNREQAVKILHG